MEISYISKNKKVSSSDRWSFNEAKKAIIDVREVRLVNQLRRLHLFPAKPNIVIINNHREFAAIIPDIKTLRQFKSFSLDLQKILHLSDGSKFKIENINGINILDLYIKCNGESPCVTARLRIYENKGIINSHRMICVDAQKKDLHYWTNKQHNKRNSFPVRNETVMLSRTDSKKGINIVESLKKNIKFLISGGRGQKKVLVTDIVFKKIIRFNSGQKTLWYHCPAFYKNSGNNSLINATEKESIVGMSPYLNLITQVVYHTNFYPKRRIQLQKIYKLFLKKYQRKKTIFNLYRTLKTENADCYKQFMIEIEASREKHEAEAFRLVEQLKSHFILNPIQKRKVRFYKN